MPRLARLDIPGLLQHVIVRGIERRDIFLDDQDREFFVKRFSSLLKETGIRCFAWAILSNHFHLLLMPTSTLLSHLMRRLLTGYAVFFNRKYSRSGHLFQNRYKSIVCEDEPYLLELVRYIHLNPLRAGLVADMTELDHYRWSGHAVLMRQHELEGQELLEILQRFGKNPLESRQRYRQFIADGIKAGCRKDLVGGGLKRSVGERDAEGDYENFDERILGSGSFVDSLQQEEQLKDRIKSKITIPELVKSVCEVLRLEPETVMRPSKRKALAEARGIVCYIACCKLGYKGNEAGRELQLGPSGVSIASRRGERAIMLNPDLEKLCSILC